MFVSTQVKNTVRVALNLAQNSRRSKCSITTRTVFYKEDNMGEHKVRVHIVVETMASGTDVEDAATRTIATLEDLMDLNEFKVIRIWDGSKKEAD